MVNFLDEARRLVQIARTMPDKEAENAISDALFMERIIGMEEAEQICLYHADELDEVNPDLGDILEIVAEEIWQAIAPSVDPADSEFRT